MNNIKIENVKTVKMGGGEEKSVALIGNWRNNYPVLFRYGDEVVPLHPVYCPYIPLDDSGYQTVNTKSDFQQSDITKSKDVISELKHQFTNTLVLTDDFYVSRIYGLDSISVVKEIRLCELPQ